MTPIYTYIYWHSISRDHPLRMTSNHRVTLNPQLSYIHTTSTHPRLRICIRTISLPQYWRSGISIADQLQNSATYWSSRASPLRLRDDQHLRLVLAQPYATALIFLWRDLLHPTIRFTVWLLFFRNSEGHARCTHATQLANMTSGWRFYSNT